MSGSDIDPPPPVVFYASGRDGFAVRAVHHLAALPAALPKWALVGGVAVAIRLAGFQRPTSDLDSVTLDAALAMEILIGSGGQRQGQSVTFTDSASTPVKFDLIDVSEGDPEDGSFLAHRFALDTATNCQVEVRGRGNDLFAQVSLPVASPSALIAMKAHAIESRRTTNPDKISGDLFDIIQLTAMYGAASIGTELQGQRVLAASVRQRCDQYFVRDAARTLGILRRDSRSMVADIDRLDIQTAAQLVEQLR